MEISNTRVLIRIVVAILLAGFVAHATGVGGAMLDHLPVTVVCAIVAFLINWLMFIPAYRAQTEHYYDLTGSFTYLAAISTAVVLSSELDSRAIIVAAMVTLWALRLGSFLFTRVKRTGKDDRFDNIKINFLRFFSAWTLQALWVVLTAACALVIITTEHKQAMGLIGDIGVVMWIVGMGFEIVADQQKTSFKKNPANSGRYISTGLWSWSRHPNYFGEMLLWSGIAVIAIPILQGWQWVAIISPFFVYCLIRYLSGINMLQEKSDRLWGEEPEYQHYKANTPLLFPMPPSKAAKG